MENLSLYIHIPFCENKCHYCNFISFKKCESEKENYINYLLKEIKLNASKDYLVKTIFIGGGTPSCLKSGDILRISNAIKENFNISKNLEFTIEANPNSFNLEKAKEYKNAGINRISFGLQTSNDKLLKLMNRIHTKKDFINAVKMAKQEGLKNINADILLGLPNQKLRDIKSTLKLITKLNLSHVSCYSLILEEGTPIFKMVEDNKLKLPKDEKTLKMYDFTLNFLKKHKIFRYEVSNFAKAGFKCMHNLTYWNLSNYLGLGLNSHSKIENVRFENYSDFTNYYKSLDENQKPIKEKTQLELTDQKEEFIMLGLRKSSGINLKEYQNLFNENLEIIKAKEIDYLLKNSLIEIVNNNLFATNLGFKVLNQIILKLV